MAIRIDIPDASEIPVGCDISNLREIFSGCSAELELNRQDITILLSVLYMLKNPMVSNLSCGGEDLLNQEISTSWREIFSQSSDCGLGQRLGVPYMRAQETTVVISLTNDRKITLAQSSMGLVAISGVVWDAGLLMADYLVHIVSTGYPLGRTLDFGCGTGIAGIVAKQLGSSPTIFTDAILSSCLEENLENYAPDAIFVPYDWLNNYLPSELSGCWDTILCSDILYESSLHNAILCCIERLTFGNLFLAYKRRHDVPEEKFLESLEKLCKVHLVTTSTIPLTNVDSKSIPGLHILVITKL